MILSVFLMGLCLPVKWTQNKNRAVLYLILSGLGVALSICGAGWLRYDAAWDLGVDRGWIEHSHDAVYNLQIQVQRLDQIGPALELYKLTGDDDKLHTAQTNSADLYSHALQIQQFVADNPSQRKYASQLVEQGRLLDQAVSQFGRQSPIPDEEILVCQQTVSLMLEQEHELLHRRMAEADEQSIRSSAVSVSVTGFSLIVVIVLFSLLIRDALRHRRDQIELSDSNSKLSGTIHALKQRARESELLSEARDELQFCTAREQAQQSAARFLERLLPATRGAICLIHPSQRMVEIAVVWNGPVSLSDGFSVEGCCGLRSGRDRWRRPGQSEVHCTHFASVVPENYLCVPMAAHGETLGIVHVECASAGIAAMVEAQLPPLHEMVEMASMAIAGLDLRSRLEEQSIRDNLTGLFNRHFMEDALDRELRRAIRHKQHFAMLMVDVDYFKRFNDDFGHEAGDTVLRAVADALAQALRGEDILCRYGGEEFLVILPEISLEDAIGRAEALRETVGRLQLRYDGAALPGITVSVGVAAYPDHGSSGEVLLKAADRALYSAKRQGRNRVVVESPGLAVQDLQKNAP